MLLTQQIQLSNSIQKAINILGYSASDIILDETKNKQHGDIATNIALKLSGLSLPKKNPREIAQQIIEILLNDENFTQLIEKYEIAGPGFINLFLTSNAKTQVIKDIFNNPSDFGYNNLSKNIILEFVSANPTGPLHVGHGRQAALGDCLANILKTQGYNVYKEFYYNDAGVQIKNLTLSVQMRAKGYNPQSPQWSKDAYNGEYINDIATAYLNQETIQAKDIKSITSGGDIENLQDIQAFAVAYLRQEQDNDLKAFGVEFDNYYLESSLYTAGKVNSIVKKLTDNKKTYIQNDEEKGSALYLKTTDYGDDKDRVMQKSDGNYTYFVPDIAYHVNKFERGFNEAINIQGFDHHGTIVRVRAGLQALEIDIPKNFPEYILHKMVTIVKDGQEVKISKRAGSYVTLRDLIEWSGQEQDIINLQKGRDAVRFFLISRKADTEFIFDIDMALKQNEENPVYYIQYAHARIASILEQSNENYATIVDKIKQNNVLFFLQTEQESNLINKLSWYPSLLKQSAKEMAPHNIAFYLRELASLFHSFYSHCRVLVEDENLKIARLALLIATKQIINNALNLLGVSSPNKM